MLLASLLWLMDTSGLLSALLPAVIAHELGHVLALRLCGTRVTVLTFEACGLRMDYGACLTDTEELLCALAGPAAGAAYALCAALPGRWLESEFLLCSAGISLCLTLFNLLPAPMLDGGRALAALRHTPLRLPGILSGSVLAAASILLLHRSCGPVLLAAGLWVMIGSCKYPVGGIK